MIDLKDFAEEYGAALDAANEYKRRAQKGLPSDRFADGANGEALVAQGIAAMQTIMNLQNAAIVEMYNDIQARGQDAVRLYTADSKYANEA